MVSKVPDDQVMSDLDSTVAWAAKTGKADTSRLGITGFCWGGRIVWLYSAHSRELKAGVAWYGRLVGTTDPLHAKNPIDLVSSLHAPVLGLYGGADTGIPLDTVEKMRAALKAANNPSEIVVYPEAPHGFNADYRRPIERMPLRTAGSDCRTGSRSTTRNTPNKTARDKKNVAKSIATRGSTSLGQSATGLRQEANVYSIESKKKPPSVGGQCRTANSIILGYIALLWRAEFLSS